MMLEWLWAKSGGAKGREQESKELKSMGQRVEEQSAKSKKA